MSIPKRRKSSAKRDTGRSHLALSKVKVFSCQKCQAPVLPHHMCLECGTYNGREVMAIVKKKEEKKKRREEKIKKQEVEAKEQAKALKEAQAEEKKASNKKGKDDKDLKIQV
ncbi:MAG: 50S ribosomal protein L32 [bacterium]